MALKLLVVTLIFVANPCQFISEQYYSMKTVTIIKACVL